MTLGFIGCGLLNVDGKFTYRQILIVLSSRNERKYISLAISDTVCLHPIFFTAYYLLSFYYFTILDLIFNLATQLAQLKLWMLYRDHSPNNRGLPDRLIDGLRHQLSGLFLLYYILVYGTPNKLDDLKDRSNPLKLSCLAHFNGYC